MVAVDESRRPVDPPGRTAEDTGPLVGLHDESERRRKRLAVIRQSTRISAAARRRTARRLSGDHARRAVVPVSVVVLTKDEEAGLGQTLSRLTAFDDVIVVDSHSTDRTVEIAEAAGVRVVQFRWDGKHPKKKQWSLDHAGARHEWVLLLDADEYPSPELVAEIARVTAPGQTAAAFDLELDYRFAGRLLQHGHRVTKRALLRPARVHFPEVDDLDAPGVREVEGHYQPQVDGTTGRLTARLQHDDVDPLHSWFDRHNRYSDWEAHLNVHPELRRSIAAARSTQGRRFAGTPLKPLVFFTYSYVLRRGFLDGRAGFDYAFALAGYYWQIGLKTRELRRGDPSPESP